MDKRIKLTAKQQSLIKRMRELITKMQEEHLGLISCEGDVLFYNKANVIDKDYGYGIGGTVVDGNNDWNVHNGKVWLSPDYDDLSEPYIHIPFDITLDREDEWLALAVEPSTKEEIEAVEKEKLQQNDDRIKELEDIISKAEAEKQKCIDKINEVLTCDGLPQKGKDYQKKIYTGKINALDEEINNAQNELKNLK